MEFSVSAIVPAYNEEKTVGLVVKALLDSEIFSEIICINDGSQDNTLKILKNFVPKITLINLKHNQGKGYAMAQGIKSAQTELIVFLDADFINLNKKHIEELIKPVFENNADSVIGILTSKPGARYVFPYLSGQRVYYKKDLLPLIKKMEPSKYGVEILLNEAFKRKKTIKVHLNNLIPLEKHEKTNAVGAVRSFIIEGVDIAKQIGRKEIISSDIKLLDKIKQEKNYLKVQRLITLIKNTKIKNFLKKYFEKYFSLSKN
jgi:polyisoprenyl-phosphate glycosyltransferase